jgi:hypothetical protein
MLIQLQQMELNTNTNTYPRTHVPTCRIHPKDRYHVPRKSGKQEIEMGSAGGKGVCGMCVCVLVGGGAEASHRAKMNRVARGKRALA